MREDLIPIGTKRRSGKKLSKVAFLVAHDTGNINSTAKNNVDYFKNSANDIEASAHIFVDDKETVLCVPLNEKAWHVRYDQPLDNQMFGDDANDIAIGVELCYFDDLKRSLAAYDRYVKELAELCKMFNLDPGRDIVGHYLLDPSRKTDPVNALRRIKKTMVDLLRDVNNIVYPSEPVIPKPKIDGMAAVDELHRLGRINSPGLWKENIMKVANLEYVFMGWLEEVKK